MLRGGFEMNLSDKMLATLECHKRFGEMTRETEMRLKDNIKDVKEAIKELNNIISNCVNIGNDTTNLLLDDIKEIFGAYLCSEVEE